MAGLKKISLFFTDNFARLSSTENLRRIAFAGAVVAVIILGLFGYRWYSVKREEAAYKVFADCVHEYEQARGGQEPWSKVELLCKAGYEQYSRSHLAPYFLAFQAEAQTRQNKYEDARVAFETAMSKLSSRSPLYTIYGTKYALLRLDSSDKTLQEAGLRDLENLANDTANTNRDLALYYLGLYYWTKDETDKARATWTTLVAMNAPGQIVLSAWAVLAQEKLQFMA
jgi:tetratricopeptide (TPR) repeat protein